MASLKSSFRARLHRRRSPTHDAAPPHSSPNGFGLFKQPSTRIEAVKARITTTTSKETLAKGFQAAAPSSQSRLILPPMSSSSQFNLIVPSGEPSVSSKPVTSASPTAAKLPTSNLVSLPPELLLHLTNFLSFNALLSLRSTCHDLHNLLDPSHLVNHRNTITSNLLASERTQIHDYRHSHPRQPFSHLWDLFYAAFEWQLQERPAKELICYGCLETKPLHSFVERMSSRGTGLGGKLATHRRCKECFRRFYAIEGGWWREHWIRKSEHRKHRSRMERVSRWVTHGDSLIDNVSRGSEVGICACCGGRQSELWWGCKGCFDKEERTRRREDNEVATILNDSDALSDGERCLVWLIERAENWRSQRDRRKRRRNTRRAEQGRWWRRMWRSVLCGGTLSWEGSWEGRVEALVELLTGTTAKQNASCEDLDTTVVDVTDVKETEWKPLEQTPLKKDRREARCSICWVPTCSKKTFMLGLAYETKLPFERWCGDCQRENVKRDEKRRWRRGEDVGHEVETILETPDEEGLEDVRGLFG